MNLVSAIVEEFEQGAWVADLVSVDAYDGSFLLNETEWTGAAVSSRVGDDSLTYTRVVGGTNGLSKVLADKYYDGSVSLQAATEDICRLAGETFGSAKAAVTLTTYERIQGNGYAALDALAATQTMIWWVDREGAIHMQSARTPAALADGVRTESDADSVFLVEPKDLELGSTYGDDAQTVRHIRWEYDAKALTARAYFLPFIFRPPTQTKYDALYNAAVDRDNGDGTIDVIAGGRFGVTKVPLFCGVPGSKVLVRGGEQVTLGFFGGDPRKPFAVAMAQNTAATKEVARNGDSVKVTLNVVALGPLLTAPSGGGPCVGAGTMDVTGTVTQGSPRLKVGD